MPLTNTEQEEVWINCYNELHELKDKYPDAYIVVDKITELNMDEADEWIMNAAYKSHITKYEIIWYKGKESIFLSKHECK